MGWLIGLEPTAFWATRRKASLSDSEGNHQTSSGGARFKAEICRLETAERGESTIFC